MNAIWQARSGIEVYASAVKWVKDSEPDVPFNLGSSQFHFVLVRSPPLSAGGPSGGVFELYRDLCSPPAAAEDFTMLFSAAQALGAGAIPPSVSHLVEISRLLVFNKPARDVSPIATGEAIFTGWCPTPFVSSTWRSSLPTSPRTTLASPSHADGRPLSMPMRSLTSMQTTKFFKWM